MRFKIKIAIEVETESLDAHSPPERVRILTNKVNSLLAHGTIRDAFSEAELDMRDAWVCNAAGVKS